MAQVLCCSSKMHFWMGKVEILPFNTTNNTFITPKKSSYWCWKVLFLRTIRTPMWYTLFFCFFVFSNTDFNLQSILSLLQERKFPQRIVPNTSDTREWAAEVFPEAYKGESVRRRHKCCSFVCQQSFSPTEPPLSCYRGQNVGHTDQAIYASFLFCFFLNSGIGSFFVLFCFFVVRGLYYLLGSPHFLAFDVDVRSPLRKSNKAQNPKNGHGTM